MAEFTKTRIVDSAGGGSDTSIASALTALGSNGGTIIVERNDSGYDISSSLSVASNTTIIGRGNTVLNASGTVPVFVNSDQQDGNSRIVISGFKINITANNYSYQVIDLRGVDNCILENLTI